MAAERERCPPRRRESSQSSCCCERARETAMSGAVGGAMGGGGDAPPYRFLPDSVRRLPEPGKGGYGFVVGRMAHTTAPHRDASPRNAPQRRSQGPLDWGPTTPPHP